MLSFENTKMILVLYTFLPRLVHSTTQGQQAAPTCLHQVPVMASVLTWGKAPLCLKQISLCSFLVPSFFCANGLRATSLTQGKCFHTRFRWRSDSVFWLYHGSSRKGSLCHTYFSTVLIRALLTRMQRYTIRNVFIDLQGNSPAFRCRSWSFLTMKGQHRHSAMPWRALSSLTQEDETPARSQPPLPMQDQSHGRRGKDTCCHMADEPLLRFLNHGNTARVSLELGDSHSRVSKK